MHIKQAVYLIHVDVYAYTIHQPNFSQLLRLAPSSNVFLFAAFDVKFYPSHCSIHTQNTGFYVIIIG